MNYLFNSATSPLMCNPLTFLLWHLNNKYFKSMSLISAMMSPESVHLYQTSKTNWNFYSLSVYLQFRWCNTRTLEMFYSHLKLYFRIYGRGFPLRWKKTLKLFVKVLGSTCFWSRAQWRNCLVIHEREQKQWWLLWCFLSCPWSMEDLPSFITTFEVPYYCWGL